MSLRLIKEIHAILLKETRGSEKEPGEFRRSQNWIGGSRPGNARVVVLHGYAENSDSWAPLAADLMKDHTVVVPDLRGIGRSSKPAGGYDKKTQAKDLRAVVTALGYDRTFVVAHDIGNMVAYAYAALYPDKVERLVVMDAPIPGIGPWSEILQTPGEGANSKKPKGSLVSLCPEVSTGRKEDDVRQGK